MIQVKRQPYRLGETVILPLTRGKNAVVDSLDFLLVAGFCWHARQDGNGWYAARKARYKGTAHTLYLHRVIMRAKDGQQIDHIDGDGLNCRRSNLRFCNHSQNQANRRLQGGTSRYRGVSRNGGTWYASIKVDGRSRKLGRHETEREAALAYDRAAIEEFGEFASVNIQPGLSPPEPTVDGQPEAVGSFLER